MNETSEKIMEVFREFRVENNGILSVQSLMSKVHDWQRSYQDAYKLSITELIKNGYIEAERLQFRLTDKGYNYLYPKLNS